MLSLTPPVRVQRQEHSHGEQSLSDGERGTSWKPMLSSSSLSASGHYPCSVLGCQERGYNKNLLWGSLRKPCHVLLKGLFECTNLNFDYFVSDVVEVER